MGIRDELDKKYIQIKTKTDGMVRENNNQTVETLSKIASFIRIMPKAISRIIKGVRDKEEFENIAEGIFTDFENKDKEMKVKIGKFYQDKLNSPNDYADGLEEKDEKKTRGPIVYANGKESHVNTFEEKRGEFLKDMNPDNEKYQKVQKKIEAHVQAKNVKVANRSGQSMGGR